MVLRARSPSPEALKNPLVRKSESPKTTRRVSAVLFASTVPLFAGSAAAFGLSASFLLTAAAIVTGPFVPLPSRRVSLPVFSSPLSGCAHDIGDVCASFVAVTPSGSEPLISTEEASGKIV